MTLSFFFFCARPGHWFRLLRSRARASGRPAPLGGGILGVCQGDQGGALASARSWPHFICALCPRAPSARRPRRRCCFFSRPGSPSPRLIDARAQGDVLHELRLVHPGALRARAHSRTRRCLACRRARVHLRPPGACAAAVSVRARRALVQVLRGSACAPSACASTSAPFSRPASARPFSRPLAPLFAPPVCVRAAVTAVQLLLNEAGEASMRAVLSSLANPRQRRAIEMSCAHRARRRSIPPGWSAPRPAH